MTHAKATLLRSLYDAFSRRDLDTVWTLLADGGCPARRGTWVAAQR
jgi:hypothetical protein